MYKNRIRVWFVRVIRYVGCDTVNQLYVYNRDTVHQDGEIGVINANGCSLDSSRVEKASQQEDILLSPAPHPHWTIRECLQQPEAIARALAFGGTPFLF